MRNLNRTKTHPHGRLVVNGGHTLAFVRISKCGSSTFVARHGLNQWIDFRESDGIFLTLCCLREPRARLLSSIPETLYRIYSSDIKGSKMPWSDVDIDAPIYEFICQSLREKPSDILGSLMKTINIFGFFDAHHEPMTNFVLSQNRKPELDPLMFPLEAMDIVSLFLLSVSGQNEPELLTVHNTRSLGDGTSRFNFSARRVLASLRRLSAINGSKNYFQLLQSTAESSAPHPLEIIRSSIGLSGQVGSFNSLLHAVYTRVKEQAAADQFFDVALHQDYDVDIRLYNVLSERCEGIAPSNALGVMPRLSQLL